MEVHQQNALFQNFADTLSAVIQNAKKTGRYDMGILGKKVFKHDQSLKYYKDLSLEVLLKQILGYRPQNSNINLSTKR